VAKLLDAACSGNKLEQRHLVYSWQPVATIQRPVAPLDCWLEGTQLVLVNTARWLPPGSSLGCCLYSCGHKPEPNSKGVRGNAKSTKGDGITHTFFIASVQRRCGWVPHSQAACGLQTAALGRLGRLCHCTCAVRALHACALQGLRPDLAGHQAP
jgi:hypothetical protein